MQMDGEKLPKATLQPLADSGAWAYARQADPHKSKLNLVNLIFFLHGHQASACSPVKGCETVQVHTKGVVVSAGMRQ